MNIDHTELPAASGQQPTASDAITRREAAQPPIAPARRSLRRRLILTLVAIAILPILGLSTVLTISSAQSNRRTSLEQLDSIAGYKYSQILGWSERLQAELGDIMLDQALLENMVRMALVASLDAAEYEQIREQVQQALERRVLQSELFYDYALLDLNGTATLATSAELVGQNFATEKFFKVGHYLPYIGPPYYSTARQGVIVVVSQPVFGEFRQLMGVLVGYGDLQSLQAIIDDNTGLGQSGITYLVGKDQTLLSSSAAAGRSAGLLNRSMQNEGVQIAFDEKSGAAMIYRNEQGLAVTGAYRWFDDLQAALFVEQDRQETGRQTNAVLAVNISFGLSVLWIALFVSLMVTHNIAEPISELAASATARAPVALERDDEIGFLGRAFNAMTLQLNSLIENLEKNVAERTQELQVQSSYLSASAEVSRAITSILGLDELLEQAVELIRQRFDLYYVGLFMREAPASSAGQDSTEAGGRQAAGQFARLRAATGEAGQIMLARGHSLPVDSASMIGWCIANAQARIAQEASMDVVRFATPELPDTRSEAAIPLRSRGRILGAISVQSSRSNAFDETAIAALQSLADQLAIAIDNARLFEESQQALEAERRAYRTHSQTAWREWLQQARGQAGGSSYSLRASEGGVERVDITWLPEMQQALAQGRMVDTGTVGAPGFGNPAGAGAGVVGGAPGGVAQEVATQAVALPIKVRGSTIGVINLRRQAAAGGGSAAQGLFSQEEVNFLENIVEQVGIALDSARLYAETQQRAEQERLVGEVTSHIRQSLDVESVLKTAVDEIYQALGLEELVIQLYTGEQP